MNRWFFGWTIISRFPGEACLTPVWILAAAVIAGISPLARQSDGAGGVICATNENDAKCFSVALPCGNGERARMRPVSIPSGHTAAATGFVSPAYFARRDWKIAEPGWVTNFHASSCASEFPKRVWYFTGNLFDSEGRRFGRTDIFSAKESARHDTRSGAFPVHC